MRPLLESFPRPLWAITASAGSSPGDSPAPRSTASGLIATWVQPVSLDEARPIAMLALAPIHFTTELLRSSGRGYLHLLRRDQIDIAWQLASASGRDRDKLARLPIATDDSGSPYLTDFLAQGRLQVLRVVDAGDRYLFWCNVAAIRWDPHAASPHAEAPLVDHEFFARLPSDQRELLKTRRREDHARLLPLHDQWWRTE